MAPTPKKQVNPFLLLLLSWICPGGGHFVLHKKFRAALAFIAVGVLFWLGIWMKAYIAFPGTPDESFALFKFLGAAGSGAHFMLALLLKQGLGDIIPYKEAFTNEYGNTCLYTAGILNILCMVDALDIRKGRKH